MIPIYNKNKIEKIKKSLCTSCKMGSCSKPPIMLLFCQIEAFEFRLRTGRYNLSNGNGKTVQAINKDINGVIIDGVPVSIEDIKRLFVNRYDTYSLQDTKNPEKFPDTKQPLTDDTILQSLLGSITIGVRSVNPETNLMKWICFDIDSDENDKPVDVVKSLLKILKEDNGLKGYVEASGSKDSYHVWVFVEPIKNNDRLLKWYENIKRKVSSINEGNVFTDKGVQKGEGYMIKLPFNIQHKNGVRSKFLNVKSLSEIVPQKLVV